MRGLALTIARLKDDVVKIALRGELDHEHAYTFDEELKRVEALGPECICLDLRELTFLDSCGLARLVAARRRAMKAGRRLVLVRGTPAVQRVFQLTAVDEAFEIISGTEALTA